MMRRIGLTALFVCAAMAHVAFAADDMALSAQAGVGDRVRPGALTPIEVILQNGPNAFNGRVRAVFYNSFQGEENTAVYPLTLAPGASKRLFLYLPTTDRTSEYMVRYEAPRAGFGWRNVASVRQRLQKVDDETPVFAVIGPEALLRSLPASETSDGKSKLYAPAFLRADQIPDIHEGLQIFDVLFFKPSEATRLRPAQIEALSGWALRGGILVVDASQRSEALRQPAMTALLPFSPEGSEQVALDGFDGEVLIARGTIREGTAIAEANGRPLVVERPHGLGSIVAFTVPLDMPSLDNWPERTALWNDILGALLEDSPKSVASFDDGEAETNYVSVATQLRDSIQEDPNTNFRVGFLFLLTGLYVVIAGPGDYILVHRLKRPRLTWITFPAIVASFTLIAYFASRQWVGGEDEVRHRARTTIYPEAKRAVTFELTDVFVGQTGDYTFEHPRGAQVQYLGDFFGLSDPVMFDALQGGFVQRVPLWTHRTYLSSETATNYPDIDVVWDMKDNEEGTVSMKNNSAYKLSPTYAFRGEFGWRLRSYAVSPGESKTLELTNSNAFDIDNFMPQMGTLTGFWIGGRLRTALGRELDSRAALARGAHMLSFATDGDGPALRMDGGAMETVESSHVIEIVTYPEGATR